ncbi:RIB43A-like with coiled-coils protein 2 isoform X3 [Eublepharis macularius]|nr:RIB43A-like with coiled-coils protein 2 isoform X3 [Eublepharis macularius]XP_054856874.1 RIB43A-like with coiled-coils protein 2 isoform X3 [Eublepharis macularius]
MKQNDKIMCILEERRKKDTLNIKKALNEFRQNHQQPERRHEFDLSDPQALKKAAPARVADNDPRCAVSGLQKFMGEDLNSENRRKFQQEQTREWLLQQQKDWANALADQKFADGLRDAQRLELDQKSMDIHRSDEETKRAICIATKEFNRTQATVSGEKMKLEKQQELEDNMTEISNMLKGDLLSENPQQAVSSFGSNRVITDRWKGMNQDQLKEIQDVQLQQVLEKLCRRSARVTASFVPRPCSRRVAVGGNWCIHILAVRLHHQRLEKEERQRNAEWDRKRIQAARAELLCERHQQRQNRELRRALDSLNAQLSQDQKRRRAALDEEVYANFPSGQYYTQFNTSSR